VKTPSARKSAERVFGLAAAKAAFATRPDDVVNIAYTASMRLALADLLRSAARRRIAYREVEADELTRMAQSVHHEGVCLLITPRPLPKPATLLDSVLEGGLLLALDGVENPHNIGAILRSAAYFGVRGLFYSTADAPAQASEAALPAAAKRVAEGGAEYVPTLRVQKLSGTLKAAARADIAVIGCDARAEEGLDRFEWPERALLVLGHEQRGLSQEVRNLCHTALRIDGSGSQFIDSLNVSVAAGIFIASYAYTYGVE
jgi:TrmH RNA methyltransferase